MSGGSRPVVLLSSQPRWPDEFREIAGRLREVVGAAALRIDHIGSTAVPGLAAKDIIDLQITVSDLDRCEGLTRALAAAGFRHGATIEHDVFRPLPETDPELRKRFMREPVGERRAHLHIRERGRFNQRYALLVRDYLRASEAARDAYALTKRQAARLFPEDIDGYLSLKDPVFHLLYETASLWSEKNGWCPDPSDA